MGNDEIVAFTVNIISAYVSNNQVDSRSLSNLILTVHKTLAQTEQPAASPQKLHEPSVPIRMSVSPMSITCLECGAEGKMLKRHIWNEHSMTPEEYRSRWNLDDDYPLVAPAYSEKRRAIAHNIGLGKLSSSDA